MAQLEVLSHACAAQVEITVFHPQVVAAVGIVLYGERWCERRAEHVEFLGHNLNVAGRHLVVLALALADRALDLNAIFTSKGVGLLKERLVHGFVESQLCYSVTVAEVDESHSSHLTQALHPSGEGYLLAGIAESQLSTSISTIHIIYI